MIIGNVISWISLACCRQFERYSFFPVQVNSVFIYWKVRWLSTKLCSQHFSREGKSEWYHDFLSIRIFRNVVSYKFSELSAATYIKYCNGKTKFIPICGYGTKNERWMWIPFLFSYLGLVCYKCENIHFGGDKNTRVIIEIKEVNCNGKSNWKNLIKEIVDQENFFRHFDQQNCRFNGNGQTLLPPGLRPLQSHSTNLNLQSTILFLVTCKPLIWSFHLRTNLPSSYFPLSIVFSRPSPPHLSHLSSLLPAALNITKQLCCLPVQRRCQHYLPIDPLAK